MGLDNQAGHKRAAAGGMLRAMGDFTISPVSTRFSDSQVFGAAGQFSPAFPITGRSWCAARIADGHGSGAKANLLP